MDEKVMQKKERLIQVLEKGTVMVHLDARSPGVTVPPALKTQAHLRLNLSYNFSPPDLSINDWGIRSTLSFSGHRFRVSIPWPALFAIASQVTQDFWMFPDDMPAELLKRKTEASEPQPQDSSSEAPTEPEVTKARGHLRLVK